MTVGTHLSIVLQEDPRVVHEQIEARVIAGDVVREAPDL